MPPATAASESTTRICFDRGGVPSASSSFASWPTATIVPIVSKKSASRIEKTRTTTARTPILPTAPSSENCPSSDRSGTEKTESGSEGTFWCHPVGLSAPDAPTFAHASTASASTVVPTTA